VWYVYKSWIKIGPKYQKPETAVEELTELEQALLLIPETYLSEAGKGKMLTARQKANKTLPRRGKKHHVDKDFVPTPKVVKDKKSLDEIFGYSDFDPSKVTKVDMDAARKYEKDLEQGRKDAFKEARKVATAIIADKQSTPAEVADARDFMLLKVWGPKLPYEYTPATKNGRLWTLLQDNVEEYLTYSALTRTEKDEYVPISQREDDSDSEDEPYIFRRGPHQPDRTLEESAPSSIPSTSRAECVHYNNCPKKLATCPNTLCNATCGGRNCTHWAGCTHTEPKQETKAKEPKELKKCDTCQERLYPNGKEGRLFALICRRCTKESRSTSLNKQEKKKAPESALPLIPESMEPGNPPFDPMALASHHVLLFNDADDFIGSGTIMTGPKGTRCVKTSLHNLTEAIKTNKVKESKDFCIHDYQGTISKCSGVYFKNEDSDELVLGLVGTLQGRSAKPMAVVDKQGHVTVVGPTQGAITKRCMSTGEWNFKDGAHYSSFPGWSGTAVFIRNVWFGTHFGDQGTVRRVIPHSAAFLSWHSGNE
jgi:hypothetical protein